MKKIKVLAHHLNVSRPISQHLMGDNHTSKHRKIVGAIIMSVGVGMTKLSMLTDLSIIHFLGEVVGFGFHGVGLLPYIMGMEKGGGHD